MSGMNNVKDEAVRLLDEGYSITPVWGLAGEDGGGGRSEKAPCGRHSDRKPITSRNPIVPHSGGHRAHEKIVEHLWRDPRWGVAMIAGTGHRIVIDADTPADVEVLKVLWRRAFQEEAPEPTVRTPGTAGGHNNGGHWYIDLDGVPEEWPKKRIITGEDLRMSEKYHDAHADIMIRGFYFIAPPTRRAKGEYVWVGEPTATTAEVLHDVIMNPPMSEAAEIAKAAREEETKRRKESWRRLKDSGFDGLPATERIAAWARSTPWADVLDRVPGLRFEDGLSHDSEMVWSYDRADSKRSLVVYGEDAETAYVPSTTLQGFLKSRGCLQKRDTQSVNMWELWSRVVCDGDMDRAFREAGIHQDINKTQKQQASSFRQEAMNRRMAELHEKLGL